MAVGAKRNGEQPDFRRNPRKKATLRGRYMLSDGREYPCRTVDISAGGVAIVSATKGKLGERVVLYLDRIGRVEGRVVRHFGGGFAIALRATSLKQQTLASTVEKLG
jgi:hypothetical protein